METRDIIAEVALAWAVISTVYIFLANTSRASKKDMAENQAAVDGALKKHSERLTKLEAVIDGLPSKDSFHKLELDVSDVKGSMRVLEEGLKPLAAGMMRIERFIERIQLDSATTRRPKQ